MFDCIVGRDKNAELGKIVWRLEK